MNPVRWPKLAAIPASQGQVVVLDSRNAGSLAGVRRWSYDGRELPIDVSELHQAQITTREQYRQSEFQAAFAPPDAGSSRMCLRLMASTAAAASASLIKFHLLASDTHRSRSF